MFSYIKEYYGKIFSISYDKDGKRKIDNDSSFRPYLFMNTTEKTEFKAFPHYNYVKKIVFKSVKDMKDSVSIYPREIVHSNIKDIVLLEKIREEKLNENYNPDFLRVLFYDIEVANTSGLPDVNEADGLLTSISAHLRGTDNYFLWTLAKSFDKLLWFKHRYESYFDDLKSLDDVATVKKVMDENLKILQKNINDLNSKIAQKKMDFYANPKIKEEWKFVDHYIENESRELKEKESEYLHVSRMELWRKRSKKLKVFFFDDEGDLIQHFFVFLKKFEIDIIVGWNSDKFDTPYCVNKFVNKFGVNNLKKISPFGAVRRTEDETKFGELIKSFEVFGFNFQDYMIMDGTYRTNKRDSDKLEDVAQDEVGFGKIEVDNLNDLWKENKQLYSEYNLRDVECLEFIDSKLGYINNQFSVAHYSGTSPAVFKNNSYINEGLFFNSFLDENLVIPSSEESERTHTKIKGAYVYDFIQGLWEFLSSFDFTGLYPSNILWGGLGHDKILAKKNFDLMKTIDDMVHGRFDFEPYKKQNQIITPNGLVIDNSYLGPVEKTIQKLLTQRKFHKKEYEKFKNLGKKEKDEKKKQEYLTESSRFYNLQLAEKVLLNSYYGACQVPSFALYNKDIAEAITSMGQLAIKYVAKNINSLFDKMFGTVGKDHVVGGDTDSIYVEMTLFLSKIPEEQRERMPFEDKIEYIKNVADNFVAKKIAKWLVDLTKYTGYNKDIMHMDREMIGYGAFWKAKKFYVYMAHWMEDYKYPEPQLVVKGIQIKRSDTPIYVKPYLKDFVIRLLRHEDIAEYVHKFEKKFLSWPYQKQAATKRVKVLAKYEKQSKDISTCFVKGAQEQFKAAAFYNFLLRKLNLEKKYPRIKQFDKINYVRLVRGNPFKIPVVGFLDELPEEFGLEEYIDKHSLYHKNAGKFFQDMADIIGQGDRLKRRHKFKIF